ncbi:hypothetical protein Tco_0924122 [Tanacetum coccineum]|uniref:Uncharacterized protein n=1 Tax=Tanacetum coccineum TaxID=301880 RepID=A0ABQ5D608_9ASTR
MLVTHKTCRPYNPLTTYVFVARENEKSTYRSTELVKMKTNLLRVMCGRRFSRGCWVSRGGRVGLQSGVIVGDWLAGKVEWRKWTRKWAVGEGDVVVELQGNGKRPPNSGHIMEIVLDYN